MAKAVSGFECLRRLAYAELKVNSVEGFAVSWFLRPLSLSKGGFAVFGFEWLAVAELVEVRCFWGLKI